jgi:hypothetical protein
VGAASSLIPAVYTGYGLVPALVVGTSAAFIGVSRMAGNKHYLRGFLKLSYSRFPAILQTTTGWRYPYGAHRCP